MSRELQLRANGIRPLFDGGLRKRKHRNNFWFRYFANHY